MMQNASFYKPFVPPFQGREGSNGGGGEGAALHGSVVVRFWTHFECLTGEGGKVLMLLYLQYVL